MKNYENQPVLYLDCYGVVLSERPYKKGVEMRGAFGFSQDIVKDLAEVAAKKVWLTTLAKNEIESLERSFDLPEPLAEYELQRPNQISRDYSDRHIIGWKLDLIIDDQLKNPRPFAWFDDNIDEEIRQSVDSAFDTEHPRLLIAPESQNGLQPSHIKEVQDFRSNIQ